LGNKSNIKQRKLLVLSLILPIVVQVVKRGGQVSDLSYADSLPVAGTKRSVRDRLGSNVDSSVLHGNKLDNKRCVLAFLFFFLSANFLFPRGLLYCLGLSTSTQFVWALMHCITVFVFLMYKLFVRMVFWTFAKLNFLHKSLWL